MGNKKLKKQIKKLKKKVHRLEENKPQVHEIGFMSSLYNQHDEYWQDYEE